VAYICALIPLELYDEKNSHLDDFVAHGYSILGAGTAIEKRYLRRGTL